MLIVGLQITNPSKTTNPYYTLVLTEDRLIKHHGAGDHTSTTYTPDADKGRVIETETTTTSLTALVGEFSKTWDDKMHEYTVNVIPIGFADVSASGQNMTSREILNLFYNSSAMRTPTAREGIPLRRFIEATRTTTRKTNANANANAATPAPPAPPKVAPTGITVKGKIIRPNGETYLPRWVGEHHDVALLQHLYSKNISARVFGAPGTGKTALIEAAFPTALTINGHGDMTVAHFVGSLLPRADGGWDWGDGPLTKAMREGRILYVDEITRIPTEVLSVLYSTMDGRNILRIDDRPDLEPIEAKEGFGVIAGYNPDTLGARALDEALISRFRVGIEVTTDYNAASTLKVPAKVIRLAKNLDTKNTQDLQMGGPGVWVPQMRELLTFRDLMNAGVGEKFAVSALLASCPEPDDIGELVSAASLVFGHTATIPTLGKSV